MHSSPLACRPDWRVENQKPGASLKALQANALQVFDCSIAICNVMWGAAAINGADLSLALCRAVNDWVVSEWLDRDPRLRASITVPLEHPEIASREIERRAEDPRFVQILLLAMGEAPLGNQRYWPIYEAADKHRLTIGIHAGTTYKHAPTMCGWPSYYVEEYVSQSAGLQSQLLSLVFEGVLSKYPQLKFVLLEGGVSWLPNILWRADKTWRGLRMEVPWITQAPSEIIRDQVHMTIRPMDFPPGDRQAFLRVIDQIGSQDMLLFSTDFPHWHFDGDAVLPDEIPADVARRMMFENPLKAYPRLEEVMA